MKDHDEQRDPEIYNDANRYGFSGGILTGYRRSTPEEKEKEKTSFAEWLLSIGVFTEETAKEFLDSPEDADVLLKDEWLIFDEDNEAVGYKEDAPQEIKDFWHRILRNREEFRIHDEKYGPQALRKKYGHDE